MALTHGGGAGWGNPSVQDNLNSSTSEEIRAILESWGGKEFEELREIPVSYILKMMNPEEHDLFKYGYNYLKVQTLIKDINFCFSSLITLPDLELTKEWAVAEAEEFLAFFPLSMKESDFDSFPYFGLQTKINWSVLRDKFFQTAVANTDFNTTISWDERYSLDNFRKAVKPSSIWLKNDIQQRANLGLVLSVQALMVKNLDQHPNLITEDGGLKFTDRDYDILIAPARKLLRASGLDNRYLRWEA